MKAQESDIEMISKSLDMIVPPQIPPPLPVSCSQKPWFIAQLPLNAVKYTGEELEL